MSELFASFDRASVTAHFRGHRAALRTGHGLFSADRIDDGTKLLLDQLPTTIAGRVLDVGCGYGALGLPIAIAAPEATLLAVDRDVVAVRYAERNARTLGLTNVEVRASLGYDAIDAHDFDLVLCNVPARIGPRGLAHLIEGGARRLAPGGELRTVVIRDLAASVDALPGAERIADGPRHSVHRFGPRDRTSDEEPLLYARDEVEVGGLSIARPHDASEDPGHARDGAPLLAELLPKSPSRALVWRSAHGAIAVLLATRGADVVAADRDLLALAFARINAGRHGVALRTQAAAWVGELADEKWPSIVAELTPSAAIAVAREELHAIAERLAPRGSALVLAPEKFAAAVLASGPKRRPSVVASRGGWQVLRISA